MTITLHDGAPDGLRDGLRDGTLGGLRDGFGRRIDYLRISLTDRCNLRCRYCMPTHGLAFAPDDALLSAAEIETVVRAAASVGFRKVRLTGGEPTLRRDVVDIVGRIAAVPGIRDVSMTTNGIRLVALAGELKAAGLTRVNIHVDSIDPARLADLMRWGKADDLWAGVAAAEAAGLLPIKLNCVVARGYNEADIVPLARLTIEHDWAVRFIELMPLGSGAEAQFSIDRYVSNADIAERIEAALGALTPLANADASDEARNFTLPGARGRVGFISPVSEPYCGNCNRMRLTADGKFHLCLLHDDEIDVRAVLREVGTGDGAVGEVGEVGDAVERVAAVLARAVAMKPIGHALAAGVHTEGRRMHAIGG